MSQPTAPDRDRSSTFAKGLRVLSVFDGDRPILGISDVARICNLDRAVARRLLLTLVEQGYLTRQENQFTLTPKVMGLAGGFLQSRRYGTLVQPVLEAQALALGRSISLAVQDGDAALYVAQATVDPGRISFGFTVGSRLPLYCTAIGRMLLALCPKDAAEGYLAATPLATQTPRTVTDPTQILTELDNIRSTGLSIVRSEFEMGVTGCAVAIPGAADGPTVLGSSLVDTPRGDAALEETLEHLHECARMLSKVLY